MADNTLNQLQIKELLSDFYGNQNRCGIDAFVVMKTEPKLKQMSLSENINDDGNTLRDILKEMVFTVINDYYLNTETDYVDGSLIADNQNKFLIINQSGNFTPFTFLDNTNGCEPFNIEDLSDASGIIFKLRKENKIIWCYQHLWSIMVPNKKKNHLMARLNRFENQTIFEEQTESLLTITRKIDILIIDKYLITNNTNLLQNKFGFHNYIYQSATEAVNNIISKDIVSNSIKLTEYIQRGKTKYAKKMMRVATSKVLLLSQSDLLDKIKSVDRWKDKFIFDKK